MTSCVHALFTCKHCMISFYTIVVQGKNTLTQSGTYRLDHACFLLLACHTLAKNVICAKMVEAAGSPIFGMF